MNIPIRRAALPALALLLLLASCVSVNKTVLDRSFESSPVPRDDVFVYLPGDEIPEHFRVAILTAEGDVETTNEGQMIDKLREEAGKLGANAIILGETDEPGTGTRVAMAVLGASVDRRTRAIAIYVGPPGSPEG